jgi:chemotaxis protein MotB
MSKRRHHHEEHEEHVNHEAWVIPYADMLTLLMGLFLIMWSIGQVDLVKLKAVSTGFADEFGLASSAGKGGGGTGVLDGQDSIRTGNDPVAHKEGVEKTEAISIDRARDLLAADQQQQAAAQAQTEQLHEVEQAITDRAGAAGVSTSIRFRTEARGLVVSIVTEGVLFDPGSSVLRPEGLPILDGIAATLLTIPNQLAIEGHTDDRPISTGQYPSNWELSTARATTVLRYLADHHHIPLDRLSAAGYADQRPVASNDGDAGRSQNRRVDITVLGTGNQPLVVPEGENLADPELTHPDPTRTDKEH